MTNEFLRHTLATIKYRFDKSVAIRSENFGQFDLGKGSRTPVEIVNHMFHVLRYTRVYLEAEEFSDEQYGKLRLDEEVERFNQELIEIDRVLATKELPIEYSKKILQGPFSDILTHIGQIAMMQRLNDKPIEGEDFSAAFIETGIQ